MSLMMPLCFALPDCNSTVFFAVLSFMEWDGLHDLNDGWMTSQMELPFYLQFIRTAQRCARPFL